jgi:poly(A) polymerase
MKGGLDNGLSADARALARALAAAGHDAVLVGGAVRDPLLHRPVTDVDLVTDATPSQVADLARGADWARSTYAVGERFGTIGVVLSDAP